MKPEKIAEDTAEEAKSQQLAASASEFASFSFVAQYMRRAAPITEFILVVRNFATLCPEDVSVALTANNRMLRRSTKSAEYRPFQK